MQLNDEPLSHYDTLELTSDATPQEIRSAYLRLKSSYGKDNIASYSIYSREETESILKKIEEAYLTLSNPERRKNYDQENSIESSISVVSEPVPATVIPSIHASVSSPTPQAAESFTFGSELDGFLSGDQDWSGLSLRRARESKRISIEDLADYTRISKIYLIALEEENYQKLPAPVYIRGFLQQISKRLKIPTEMVVEKYLQRMKAARPDKF